MQLILAGKQVRSYQRAGSIQPGSRPEQAERFYGLEQVVIRMTSFWEEIWDAPLWVKLVYLAVTAIFVVAIIAIESGNEYVATLLNNTMSKLLHMTP